MDFKAAVLGAGDGDLADGEIIALVSVFGNVDSFGDVVIPGAFSKSLIEWETRGDPIPFIWAHDWTDPFSHIGVIRGAEETDAGLRVRAFISPEERDLNAKAAQVYRLLKNRRVTQFSFAFDIIDGAFAERDGREVYELRELKIHEIGPCLLGVNQETELIAAKASRLSSLEAAGGGRKAYQNLTMARDAIDAILAKTDPGDGQEPHTDPPATPAEQIPVQEQDGDSHLSGQDDDGERRNEPGSTNQDEKSRSACGTAVSPATATLLAALAEQEETE
jgi:HK97 family phage prohead protease